MTKARFFLTKPLDNHGWEWRCYMRDPDGYPIEVGQYTQMALDRFKNKAELSQTALMGLQISVKVPVSPTSYLYPVKQV